MALTLNTSHPLYPNLVELIGVDPATGVLASAKVARTFSLQNGANYPTTSGTFGKAARATTSVGGIGTFGISPAVTLDNQAMTLVVVTNSVGISGGTPPYQLVGSIVPRTPTISVTATGKAGFSYFYSNTDVLSVSNTSITVGAHVTAITHSSAGTAIYVDGVLEDSDAPALDPNTAEYSSIGGVVGQNAMNGDFVWLAWFDRVLTAGEIALLTSSVQPNNVIGLLDGASQGGAPTVSTVSVTPATITVTGGATQQFSATVSGTNNPSQSVTWSVSGGGSINASGLYTAPAAGASSQSVTVTATSTADNTKAGTAAVTVPATAGGPPTVSSVSVSPGTATVAGLAQQTFTATVSGTNGPSQLVNWTVAPTGTITSGGVLTAPAAISSTQTLTITATSIADGTKAGTAIVTVPAAAGAGIFVSEKLVNNTGQVLSNISVRWSWYANGRIGALASITPVEGVGTTSAQGHLTLTGLASGPGLMVAAQWVHGATDDLVFYQAGTVA